MIYIYLVAILVNISVVLFNVHALFKWLYLLVYIHIYVYFIRSSAGEVGKYL